MQDSYKEVIIVLIAGTIIFLVLSGVVIFILLFYQKKRFQHRQQLLQLQNSIEQELLKTQLETQEETFQQIGEELHDNVGQLLSSAKILLGITERSLLEPPQALVTAEETLGKAIQDIRSLSKSLNKEWLSQFNLVENLHMEADRINTSRTIQTTVQSSEKFLPLSTEAQIILFRVVQEALQNCIKHADASEININISSSSDELEILIADDGIGFDKSNSYRGGVGILNMMRRTKLMGGTIDWDTLPGKGTKVSIRLPVNKNTI